MSIEVPGFGKVDESVVISSPNASRISQLPDLLDGFEKAGQTPPRLIQLKPGSLPLDNARFWADQIAEDLEQNPDKRILINAAGGDSTALVGLNIGRILQERKIGIGRWALAFTALGHESVTAHKLGNFQPDQLDDCSIQNFRPLVLSATGSDGQTKPLAVAANNIVFGSLADLDFDEGWMRLLRGKFPDSKLTDLLVGFSAIVGALARRGLKSDPPCRLPPLELASFQDDGIILRRPADIYHTLAYLTGDRLLEATVTGAIDPGLDSPEMVVVRAENLRWLIGHAACGLKFPGDNRLGETLSFLRSIIKLGVMIDNDRLALHGIKSVNVHRGDPLPIVGNFEN
ncbi:MAG: hypothetical protein LBM73_03105 [Candidatus Nomurabacteria bacterium]|jgi:hypothetical protein|nr:hypothetical protein [Candidatus Nomurabacteria bacterium]